MNLKEEYMLDLGVRKNNSCFFSLLIYLNEKGYEKEATICDELCIDREEIFEFYKFQEDIGYINMSINRENEKVYYLEERGIRAYKNLVDDRDRLKNAMQAYKEYVKKHPLKIEEFNYIISKPKIIRKTFKHV